MDKESLREMIAKIAYDFYEKRGGMHGNPHDDWIRAEKIVMERLGKKERGKEEGAAPMKKKAPSTRAKGKEKPAEATVKKTAGRKKKT